MKKYYQNVNHLESSFQKYKIQGKCKDVYLQVFCEGKDLVQMTVCT